LHCVSADLLWTDQYNMAWTTATRLSKRPLGNTLPFQVSILQNHFGEHFEHFQFETTQIGDVEIIIRL